MGFGFGQGADMQRAYNSNKQMVGKRKALKDISAAYKLKDKALVESKLSANELEAFKRELHAKRKKEALKKRVALLVISLIVIIVMVLVLS